MQAMDLVVVGCVLGLAMARVRVWRGMRSAFAVLARGSPGRFRALVRMHGRSIWRPTRAWLVFYDAVGLFWAGAFERALDAVHRASPPADGRLETLLIALEVECLVFCDRAVEARELYGRHEERLGCLAPNDLGVADGATLDGILRFHAGEIDASWERLHALRRATGGRTAASRVIHFYLAAIANKRERRDEARLHLEATILDGGDVFIARWATETHEEIFAGKPAPPEAHREPRRLRTGVVARLRALATNLGRGPGTLLFRRTALRNARFGNGDVVLLVAANLLVAGLGRSLDYADKSTFFSLGALAIAAPILFVAAASAIAAMLVGGDEPRATLRIAGGYYCALPILLVLQLVLARRPDEHAIVWRLLHAGLGLWGWAAFLFVVRRSTPGKSILRLLATGATFTVVCLVPLASVATTPLWFPHSEEKSFERDQADLASFFFDQANRTHEAESLLVQSRPNVVDLYFVGFAGWGEQDVFVHEVSYAKELFDRRFDTVGRSILLSNDHSTRDTLPAATTHNLRHVLATVGSRMNREEDVLFLLVTSHGSERGLAIGTPWAPDLVQDDDLTPAALRSMLDEAGITWRVLMIAGCYSGVFLPALQDSHTLVATASTRDRTSFGCAVGRPFTEFGRAVLSEQLEHERSFLTAFTGAGPVIQQRETQAGLTPSEPQLFVGSAIRQKLETLERRLSETDR
jgi:hypothetical protein